ncbi:cyclase family protein [Lysinibacillus sp. 54212]|uniref:cyclase family protein n=1 Tax=Lysinibacillus sp. 54212 TaxID=3119829 RepID=UPI002FC67637
MTWIDISQPLRSTTAVWPGDAPFSYRLVATLEADGANVGEMTASMHIGTHVDAPFHYKEDGVTIDRLSPELFIGEALVVDLRGHEVIYASHFADVDLTGVSRVLVKLRDEVEVDKFPVSYPIFDESVAEFLCDKGVKLIGVDTPSVDAVENVSLTMHNACAKYNLIIIENLLLQDVSSGLYDFIGLPLRVEGGDGSPIRAVLKRK